jgi:hypothetical protein
LLLENQIDIDEPAGGRNCGDFEDDEDMEQGEEVVGHVGQQEALSKNKKKRKLSSDAWNYFHYGENKQSSLFTVNCKYCTYKTVKPLKVLRI